jgi:hypothetical protein
MLIPADLASCSLSGCRADSGNNAALQSPRHGLDINDIRPDRYDLVAGLCHDGLETLHADRKLPSIDKQVDDCLTDFAFAQDARGLHSASRRPEEQDLSAGIEADGRFAVKIYTGAAEFQADILVGDAGDEVQIVAHQIKVTEDLLIFHTKIGYADNGYDPLKPRGRAVERERQNTLQSLSDDGIGQIHGYQLIFGRACMQVMRRQKDYESKCRQDQLYHFLSLIFIFLHISTKRLKTIASSGPAKSSHAVTSHLRKRILVQDRGGGKI